MTEPQQLVEHALATSTADAAVVIVEEHTETNLRWANNALSTNGQAHTPSVTVISILDGGDGPRAGVVTRSVSTLEELETLTRAAERSARDAAPADDAAPLVTPAELPDPPVSGRSADGPPTDRAPAGWDDPPHTTDVGVFAQFAPALGAAFTRWAANDELLFGFAEHQLTSTYLGTSTGVRRRADEPDGRLELNGKSADGNRSAWAGRPTRDFADLDAAAVDALADGLRERLSQARRRIELPPGRYETILPPTAVADLLVYTYWNLGARDADEGRSVFSAAEGRNRLGDQLCALPLTMRSDPHAPGLQCADFEIAAASDAGRQSVFDNGRPVTPASWIRDGRLAELVRSSAYARQTDTTARPAVGNLIVEPPAGPDGTPAGPTLEQMIAGTERGLLLTCLWYIRLVDPQTFLLTGLTRDGVYLVEDGVITGAVNNFRFNESPVDLLGRATEIGVSTATLSREWSDYFRRTAMPAIRVPDYNMSTVSAAT